MLLRLTKLTKQASLKGEGGGSTDETTIREHKTNVNMVLIKYSKERERQAPMSYSQTYHDSWTMQLLKHTV